MDDWQGCLAPDCQAALVQARDGVSERGGAVVTVEDFLLALLDSCIELPRFLRRCGVDLDELVRTVQCEQPIITEVGGDGALSSQLIDWLARAREVSDSPWLDWGLLLRVLSVGVERLRDKAYVAVLEQVSQWPGNAADSLPRGIEHRSDAPLVVTDADWLALAEDVAVITATADRALVWIQGDRGTGKSCWLQVMLAALERDYVELDLRRPAELLANHAPAMPAEQVGPDGPWPLLVLDNLSPSELMALMDSPNSLALELVLNWRGPLLLLGPAKNPGEGEQLAARLGCQYETFGMPGSSALQREAILTAKQAAIEKRWNIELPLAVLRYAATRRSLLVSSPGGMLQWVERAAARLDLFARCGPMGAVALAGREETLRRQALVAMARSEDAEGRTGLLAQLELQRTALEVAWHERKQSGRLRRLSVTDLHQELERWLAARGGPVHYVLHCEHEEGESAGAGSGNLYS